jgi:hypothetical protein
MMACIMHAFLIVGANPEGIEAKLTALTRKLKAERLDFPLAKIEDVRVLAAFTNLKVVAPTAIVLKEIDLATLPAQNAFLKNLEEPQENLYYLITAVSEKAVLPTVASRCQIIRVLAETQTAKLQETLDFLKMTPDKKLEVVDRIRQREEAIAFTENLLKGCHFLLQRTKDRHLFLAQAAKAVTLTRKRLKANGNVTIQLTNLAVNG